MVRVLKLMQDFYHRQYGPQPRPAKGSLRRNGTAFPLGLRTPSQTNRLSLADRGVPGFGSQGFGFRLWGLGILGFKGYGGFGSGLKGLGLGH